MNFPAGRRRQGRPEQHRRQPRPVLLDLVQGHRRRRRRPRKKFFSSGCPRRRRDRRRGSTPATSRSSRAPTSKLAAPTGRGVPQVRLRHVEQRQELRAVLGPGAAARPRPRRLLDNIAKLFQLSDHPAAVRRQHERRSSASDHGRSARRPEAAARPGRRAAGRERPGRPGWRCRPLLFFLAFGVVPLVGVLAAVSFTPWDGIGEIIPSGLASWQYVLTDPGLPHALWVTFEVMVLSWAGPDPDEHPARASSWPGASGTARSSRCSTSSRCCSARRRSRSPSRRCSTRTSASAPGCTCRSSPRTGSASRSSPSAVVDLRRVLAVHPVPLADLPGRRPADPDLDVRGGADRRRRPGPAVLLASPCRS